MQYGIFSAASIALFGVFGLYSILRILVDWLFPPQGLCIAVEVLDKRDAEALDMLLTDAVAKAFCRGGRPIVLLSTSLMDGTVGEGDALSEQYAALLDRFGAECYLIEP